MKVLFISTDRNIFDENSAAAKRMRAYGEIFGELHIIAYARRSLGLEKTKLSERVTAYPTNSLIRWRYAADAARIAKDIPRCDIVSVQDPFDTALAGIFISRAQQIPLQVQVHTDFLSPEFAKLSLLNRFRVWSAQRALREADCIRVVSERIKQSLKGENWKLEVESTVLPIPIEQAAPDVSLERPAALAQFEKTVLVVSRLEKEKDVGAAIRAFARAKTAPTTGLVIVGAGNQHSALEALARSLGIGERVIFAGAVPDTAPYYAHADAFLLTSRYDGYGMAVMEAAQANCPIVMTNVGVAGYELPREAAYICAVGDTDCLARGIAETLAGGPAVAERVAWAREAGKGVMAWDTYTAHFKDLLTQCGRGK